MNEGTDQMIDPREVEKEQAILELGEIWTKLGQMGNDQHEIQDVMRLQEAVRSGRMEPAAALREARIIFGFKQEDH